MFNRLVRKLWGDLQGEELKKFLYLMAGAFFLIGAYVPLRSLKQSLFLNIIGYQYVADVKMYTVLATAILVFIYTKLVDSFSKQKLVYVFVTFYATLGFSFAYLLADPLIGVANTTPDPTRLIGWGFYLFAESYLTIMMALYWSFVSDITSSSSAKKGYGMIVFGSQTGGFLLSLLGERLMSNTAAYATRVPQLVFLSSCMFVVLGGIVWLLTHTVDPAQMISNSADEKKASQNDGFMKRLLGGVRVLLTRPYVAGIFGLVFFQEVISALMDIQMSTMVGKTFAEAAYRAKFIFQFNMLIQFVSCSFALLGTSYIHRRFGTRACLIGFPFGLLLCAIAYLVKPNLYLVALFMLMIKALHYAMNQPVKESLYIPTTRDVKYKAKALIDMLGLRGSKMGGAFLSKIIGGSTALVGGAAVIGLTLWTMVAGMVGTINERAVRNKKTIS
ncbi:MAG: Npt1/Npt2 family nucleotide transporter [Candidatus Dependentiae bacterium]|jgi:AAA family ATP:ADP antiporter